LEVQSARYNKDSSITAVINGVSWFVPNGSVNNIRGALAAWEADGNAIEEYVDPDILPPSVDSERDRRIDAGFTFNGIKYDSDTAARENLSGAATAALSAIIAGATAGDYNWLDPSSEFEWIAQDNTRIPLDAQSTFALGQAALSHKSAHIFAARALKDQSPIPLDFADDAHWPA
jgi:hypothetical protein